ncbi:hypothetical protein V2J94_11830 [Streptomyces sp. DSM 41524]|uniref:DUF7919 domain-containing protein n=1 Tax=Streptomyces asiaticus subsp. ignotus TaxID=3098222 RepID=A0ABU7PTX9_9ACTN|nr:hypothetical protein [Streptomyces sp. DASNCL29]MEE4592566.1 hypothetical protein [Streptomyces sp. DSM 41524]
MRYEDGSPYAYTPGIGVPQGVQAVNVGWLERQEEFPRGEVPTEFVHALAVVCRDHSTNRMRGWQSCTLPHPEGKPPYPVVVEVDGTEVTLGSAEIRLLARDGRWLIAPNLVLHYVAAHGYLPPREFIEAVTARRAIPEPPSGMPRF